MWTASFWKQALERAIKTAAQVGAAALGVNGLGVTALDWQATGLLMLGAALASILTSLATSEVGEAKGSPSAVALTRRE